MYVNPALRLITVCFMSATIVVACGKDSEKAAGDKNSTASTSKGVEQTGTPGNATSGSNTSSGEKAAKTAPKIDRNLSPEDQIKETLNRWCEAQTRGGYNEYRAFYATEFSGVRRVAKKKPKTFDRAGWLADRIHGFDSPVKVDCLNPKITLSSDNKRAEVIFEQYWRSNTYADQDDKKIIMAKQADKWLLIYEDMLTAKKWKRLNFRDGSPATAGPAPVKVGRLRLRSALPLVVGKDKPMKDYVHDYCYSQRPKSLRGFQMKVKAPADADIAAYRFRIRGSTTVYEDDEGYYECNKRRLVDMARGEVPVNGNSIEIELDEATKSWPCYYKVEVKAVDSEGVPLAKGRITGDFSCPE